MMDDLLHSRTIHLKYAADLHHQCHRGAALEDQTRRQNKGHFPRDEPPAKSIYLARNTTSQGWKRSAREWHAVKSQLAIMFEDRFPMASLNASGHKISDTLRNVRSSGELSASC